MTEMLHLWALAPAAVGTCCMAADRRRVRAPELVASGLMLLAMLDLARAHPVVVPVVWAAVLLIAAMALAAVRGVQVRRAAGGAAGPDAASLPLVGMTLHTAIGMVVMGALVLMMGAHAMPAVPVPESGMAGMHSAGAGGLVALVTVAAVAYAAVSVLAALRAHTRLDGAQFLSMGASTALMAVAVAF